MFSYAYALILICKYDNSSLQKQKSNRIREVEQPKYQEEKIIIIFLFEQLCLGDDVTQNVSSARETWLFLA